jgi:hypothetical protein
LQVTDDVLFSKANLRKLGNPKYLEKLLSGKKAARRMGVGVEFETRVPVGKNYRINVSKGGRTVRTTPEDATLSVSSRWKDGKLVIEESYTMSVTVVMPNGSLATLDYGLNIAAEIKPNPKNPEWRRFVRNPNPWILAILIIGLSAAARVAQAAAESGALPA